jgi:plastocyanin
MMGGLPYGLASALLFAAAVVAHAGSVGGTASVDGAPAANAVVYLEGGQAPPTPTAPPRAVMDQKNLTFVPRVLPVMRGTVVEFTNSDDVQHNVFTPSAIGAKFNLGTYDPGAVRTVTFSQTGEVLVLCNIHMEMEARILVLDGPYFSTVGQDGGYRIGNVPAGTYVLKIWREHWLPLTKTVDLPATGDVTVDIVAGR